MTIQATDEEKTFPKLRLQNFGPLRNGHAENDGWLDIRPLTLFIGEQGSGKSCLAKLISTFSWLEKVLFRGDFTKEYFESEERFKKQLLAYHRLENYLQADTHIEYQGEAYCFEYVNEKFSIRENGSTNYRLPQIIYIPAERNFVSYLKSARDTKNISDALQEFVSALGIAKKDAKNEIPLPIGNVAIKYQELNDTLYLRGENFQIELGESASGFQSVVPLYLVSRHLANSIASSSTASHETMSADERERFRNSVAEIYAIPDLTLEQRKAAISVLSKRFNKNAFINVVEEPEQNLFPSSQGNILTDLLKFNNLNQGNKLILTTHSPYILTNINNALLAGQMYSQQIKITNPEELSASIPESASIKPEQASVYLVSPDKCENLIHPETGLIGENKIDECSDKIYEQFDKLQNLERK